VLGISFALPVLHGKTRRGALVFDVADLFKDAIVLPHAFNSVEEGLRDQEFRDSLVEICVENEVMDCVIDTIKKSAK
jgi:CRISP-associated protein Cas1